ncbi:MAG: hypothetical protein JRH20_09775 [Deltaproteobacteria bacterium]|nr:hypothetical protein [Deltaproteobacteria bacterium]
MRPERVLVLLSLFVLHACSGDSTPSVNEDSGGPTLDAAVGALGGPCFPNQTCFEGRVCLEGRCSSAPDAGSQDASATDTGAQDASTISDAGPQDASTISDGSCVDECNAGERRCSGDGYVLCGQHDTDSCLESGPVISCGPAEVCRQSDGQCVLECTTPPCPCQEGEKEDCVDIGECSGGFRQCVAGEFGPCQWTAGPQPESCDGKDNDCDGAADEADDLVPPPCDKRAGVCVGATQSCGGQGGWLPCTDAVYKAHAGDLYEVSETLCDGKDNDCNSETDEPAHCCTPQCASKACGADDGCGHACATGSCSGLQDACIAGECVCQPSCIGKACGAADGCGGRCKVGFCGSNESCVAGGCLCSYVTCDGVCCGSGELCQQNQCVSAPQSRWKDVTPFTNKHLYALWGTSASNIWAGGQDGALYRYNGVTWSAAHSGTSGTIREFWGSSPTNIWAVGGSTTQTSIVLHYNGSSWREVTPPSTRTSSLKSIWGTGPSDIWAVGPVVVDGSWANGQIAHYDGSSWSPVALKDGYLNTIWGSGPQDVWARGTSTFHYEGSAWVEVNDGFAGSHKNATWGVSASDWWTVGLEGYDDDGGVQRYDGSTWTSYAPPVAVAYEALWGSGPDRIFATGSHSHIIVFNGQGWDLSRQGAWGEETLYSLWGSSANDVWAVGVGGRVLHLTP